MIKISKLADYAVVILIIMAESDEEIMSAAKLSLESRVPEPTVSKILKMLSKGGIIESRRGIHGGYALCMKPADITMEDIILVIDGPVLITACAGGKDVVCSLGAGCKMHGRWNKVNEAIRDALSCVSLHSIMQEEQEICPELEECDEDCVRAMIA